MRPADKPPRIPLQQALVMAVLAGISALWQAIERIFQNTAPISGKLPSAFYYFIIITLFIFLFFIVSYPLQRFYFKISSREQQLRSLLLVFALTILVSWSGYFTLPKTLQPENRLTLNYESLPDKFPDVLIESFDNRFAPTLFLGTDQGVSGLMELQQAGQSWTLSGQTNFRGDLTLLFDENHPPLPQSIQWNGRLVQQPERLEPLRLSGNANPFSGKPAFLRVMLCLLIFSRLVSLFLGFCILIQFGSISLHWLGEPSAVTDRRFLLSWQLTALAASAFLLFSPLMQLPVEDRILLLMLALAGIVSFPILRRKTAKAQASFGRFSGYAWAAALWGAVSLSGNRLWILPRTTNHLTALASVTLISAVIFSFVLLISVVALLEALLPQQSAPLPKNQRFRLSLLLLLILLIPLTLSLIAYNPAISSMDSQGQWWQATGRTPIDDAHSPFHTLIMRWLILICPTPLFIALVQLGFYCFLSVRMLSRFARHGLSPKLLVLIAFLLGLTPCHFLTTITIWKDVPYTLSLLWLTDILIRLTQLAPTGKTAKWMAVETAVCLFFVSQFRHNGLLPGAMTALFLLGFAFRKRRFHPVLSVLLYLLAMVLFNGPVRQSLQIIPMDSQQTVIGLNIINDLLAVEKLGGTLPENAVRQLETVLPERNRADFSFFQNDTTWRRNTDLLRTETAPLIRSYLETILTNPLTFARALLLRLDILYAYRESPYGGFTDSVNWTDADLAGFPRRQTAVKKPLDSYLTAAADSPLYPIIWRGGFSFMMAVFAVTFLIRGQRMRRIWILLPLAGNVLSLYLATYPAFRYSWPTLLLSAFVLPAFLLPETSNISETSTPQ